VVRACVGETRRREGHARLSPGLPGFRGPGLPVRQGPEAGAAGAVSRTDTRGWGAGIRPPAGAWVETCGALATSNAAKAIHIMVVIRLARGGAKKRPFYNIVVADSRERRDGRFIERVGYYNPMAAANEQALRVAMDRVTHWVGVGAQPSPTVRRLVEQAKKAA
jgi:small subunit ribosomal protein S16